MTTTETPKLRGLTTVRLKRTDLIERLEENRDNHRGIFEDALDGWKAAVEKELKQAHDDARKGRDWRVGFNLPRPTDHTEQYDEAIELLKMSLDDELELTVDEFSRYVMDQWGWKQQFNATTSQYAS